jgi:hypothetical protein
MHLASTAPSDRSASTVDAYSSARAVWKRGFTAYYLRRRFVQQQPSLPS